MAVGRLETTDPATHGFGVTGPPDVPERERRRNHAGLARLACFQRLKRTKVSQINA